MMLLKMKNYFIYGWNWLFLLIKNFKLLKNHPLSFYRKASPAGIHTILLFYACFINAFSECDFILTVFYLIKFCCRDAPMMSLKHRWLNTIFLCLFYL